MAARIKKQALLVTTSHKGVFFGYGFKSTAKDIELIDARMCVSWSADMHGVLGLASKGPSASCRISDKVSSIILKDVTAQIPVSADAIKRWEESEWK